ncbi:MAG: RNA polymerase sigma factor [Bacteroidetes bacterium]|nr:RNA polymerase sigma factor [Bacteroidota bacterium]
MTIDEFKIKVLPLKNKLFRLAQRLLNDRAEAEDMVQEAIIRLWTRKDDLDNYNSIEAFAMSITKNLCLDILKSAGRKNVDLVEVQSAVGFTTPHSVVEMRDTMTIIHQIIATLPAQQQMIIHMRDIEGYEFDEIASIMDVNLNVIRVNLSRARKKVRDALININRYELRKN